MLRQRFVNKAVFPSHVDKGTARICSIGPKYLK